MLGTWVFDSPWWQNVPYFISKKLSTIVPHRVTINLQIIESVYLLHQGMTRIILICFNQLERVTRH